MYLEREELQMWGLQEYYITPVLEKHLYQKNPKPSSKSKQHLCLVKLFPLTEVQDNPTNFT